MLLFAQLIILNEQGVSMYGLSPELQHKQVVGKISFINRNLALIDPAGQMTKIREDHQTEIEWNKKKAHEIFEGSKHGELPDLAELSKRSFVLQELSRFITLIKPFTLSNKQIEVLYNTMKNQPDLEKSYLHKRLNEIEQLTRPIPNKASSANLFLDVLIAKLQNHLAEHGLQVKDQEAQALEKFIINMRESALLTFEEQFQLFKNFMSSQISTDPFSGVLDLEKQQQFILELVEKLSSKLSSNVLKERMLALKDHSLNKELLTSIEQIFAAEKQLQSLEQIHIGSHKLSREEVETILSSTKEIERTVLLSKIKLLYKAFPGAEQNAESLLMESNEQLTKTLHSPEFLYRLITAGVMQKINTGIEADKQAALQLCNSLKQKQVNIPLDSNANMDQTILFLEDSIDSIVQKIPHRKEVFTALGYNIPTFREVETVIEDLLKNKPSEIIEEFYLEIQKAKREQFYEKDGEIWVVKQIEHISGENVKSFFDNCCMAGINASQKLADNRSLITVIQDVLRAIANWAMKLIGFGSSSQQFFKPPRTAIDDISQALNELRVNLSTTLNHLSPEPTQGIEAENQRLMN